MRKTLRARMAARHASVDMGGGFNHGLSHFFAARVGHDDDAHAGHRRPPGRDGLAGPPPPAPAGERRPGADRRRAAPARGRVGHLAAAYQLLHRQYDAISIAHAALRECRILQPTVRQRDDVVAEMHQRLEEARHQVDLLKARRPAPSRHVHVACADDFPPAPALVPQRRRRRRPHAACVDCAERVLKAVNANPCLSYTHRSGASRRPPTALRARGPLRHPRRAALPAQRGACGRADHV